MATPVRSPNPEAPSDRLPDTAPELTHTAAQTPTQSAAGHRHPRAEEIAREAYLIYLANGSQDGRDQDDWYEAETRLVGPSASRQAGSTPQQAAAQLEAVDTRDRTPG
jgi:hypothetical protein